MKKIVFFLLSIIIFTSLVSAIDNCPPVAPPKIFRGNVYYNGTLLNGEFILSAMIGSDKISEVHFVDGYYSNLQVAPCSGVVGEITFIINGVQALENSSWYNSQDDDWGKQVVLDLNLNQKPLTINPCGNGEEVINLGEECDGTNLAGRSIDDCGTGMIGTISCSETCEIDYANCTSLYCGDGICNNGETCSTCSADCGACPPSGGGGGGGGGSSGGGGGGGSSSSSSSSGGTSNYIPALTDLSTTDKKKNETIYINETGKSGDSSITSLAILDFAKSPTGVGSLLGMVIIIAGIAFFVVKKKSSKK